MTKIRTLLTRKNLYRLIYWALLLVLTPHTAWAFSKFEPGDGIGWPAWAAAVFFEAVIAVLTEAAVEHLRRTPNYTAGRVWLRRWGYRLQNAPLWMLVIAVGVSTLANFAHAVEFSAAMQVFSEFRHAERVYQVAFGAILPMVSLVYAVVLASTESEPPANPDLTRANSTIRELRQRVRSLEGELNAAKSAVRPEFAALNADDKRARILAAHQLWPELPGRSIAVITGSSPAHVSEVLRNGNGNGNGNGGGK